MKRRSFMGLAATGGAVALAPWVWRRHTARGAGASATSEASCIPVDYLHGWDNAGRPYRLVGNSVERVDPDGRALWAHGSDHRDLNAPSALAFDSSHLVHVADMGNGRVQVLSPEGEIVRTLREIDGGQRMLRPRSVAFDTHGRLHVADVHHHCVHVFERDGRFAGRIGSFGRDRTGLNGPRGLAFSHTGELHVVDAGHRRILVFSPSGGIAGDYGRDAGLSGPSSIAFGADGMAYVADTGAGSVFVFHPDGRLSEKLTPMDGDGRPVAPLALSVGPEKTIHVVLGPRVFAA